MSYRLEKPYSDDDYANFIVNYNHNLGLSIQETVNAVFALEKNEILQDGIPVIDKKYNEKVINERKNKFLKEFFKTSQGWIRRKVKMKDSSEKDFLGDILLPIKAGIEAGKNVVILTYSEPDYTVPLTDEYMETLQCKKNANAEFVQECLLQIVNDFGIGG